MFRSLSGRLVATYSLIILLCLMLAGSAFVYLMRDYQRQIKLNQLSDLAVPISWQVRLLERSGATSDQMSTFLQDRSAEMGVRILLVDGAGQVVVDSSNSLIGEQIPVPPSWQPKDNSRENPSSITTVAFVRNGSPGFVFIVAQAPPQPQPRSATQSTDRATAAAKSSSYLVALAVPEQSLTSSWLELAPRLGFAGLVSMIVSIGVAFMISRSISKPVVQMTRAAEEMAKGNYEQHIEVAGRDEIARLALTFNNMARQVNTSHRTLKDFLANVSHELRTPLTSVQGFSQAMVDGTITSPEEYADAGQIINEESERMRRMVEDLLLLSKIETGQLPLNRETLDLRELLRACVRRATPQAQQATVSIRLEAEQAASFAGDEGRLEEVFRNLLDNAIRHTPREGVVTVTLSTPKPQRPTGNGQHGSQRDATGLSVSVHNTGSYIPPEDTSRIFERFYQVDKSRARTGDGSGLGLAIAQEIVLAHGGSISVKSDLESGTSFIVAFNNQQSAKDLTRS